MDSRPSAGVSATDVDQEARESEPVTGPPTKKDEREDTLRGVSPHCGIRFRVFQYAVRAFLFPLFRYRRRGWRRIPDGGPVLLVSNHASHLDPVMVGAATERRLFYLARSTLFRPRLFAWFIRSFGAVPIEREGHGLGGVKTTLALLREGCAVVVFPEGTRTRDGSIGPLRGGFVNVAKRTAVSVVPVWVDGTFEVLPRGRRFPRPRKIEVRVGAPFRVPVDLEVERALEHVKEQWEALAEGRPVPRPGGQIPSGA